MKAAHISDLHLGRRLHQSPLIGDQRMILQEIQEILTGQDVDVLIIAGDVYDKPVPPAEAVTLFDEFLVALTGQGIQVLVISGNHDSPERIAFGARLMEKSGVHLSPVYNGEIEPVVLADAYGETAFYLIPFLRPAHVRHFFPEEQIETYADAMKCVIGHLVLDPERRNIAVAHQFVTGASVSGSEELSVGGLDEIPASVFDGFDYVALGHIHGMQQVAGKPVYYSGTPLKYSFSEAEQKKYVQILEMKEKGDIRISKEELIPPREMMVLRGSFEELTDSSCVEKNADAYIRAVLTDEIEIVNGYYKLKMLYPNLLQMEYDNTRTRGKRENWHPEAEKELTPELLFEQFYEEMNHQPLTGEQMAYFRQKTEKIWGEDEP